MNTGREEGECAPTPLSYIEEELAGEETILTPGATFPDSTRYQPFIPDILSQDICYFLGSLEMLNYRAIRSRGFHPRRCGPPDAITLNRCYVIIAKRRGGMGGQALSPPSSCQDLEFHIKIKGILQSHFLIFLSRHKS